MKKRRTPKTNTIKATATKAVEAVKETAEKVTDKIAEEAPMLAENITAKTEEIMQLYKNNIEILNDLISKKHEFNGFMTILSYRAKNNAGNVVMDEILYFFDKDLTKIVARYDQNDLIGLQGFDFNDLKLDFEEELSSLMDK